jgi:hypothetical protein
MKNTGIQLHPGEGRELCCSLMLCVFLPFLLVGVSLAADPKDPIPSLFQEKAFFENGIAGIKAGSPEFQSLHRKPAAGNNQLPRADL